MPTARLFFHNPSPNPTITGTEQVGDIAATVDNLSPVPAIQCWNGPNEDLGFVIAYTDPTGDHPNSPERITGTNYVCNLGFLRTGTHSETEFIELAKKVTGNNSITSGPQAKTVLNSQGYWTNYQTPILSLDAGDPLSYPGTGTIWTDTVGGLTFSLENGQSIGNNSGPTYDSNNGGSIYFAVGYGIGGSDYAECLTSLPSLPTFTISVWIKWMGESTYGAIISEIQSGSGPINYRIGRIGSIPAFISAGYRSNGSWRNTTTLVDNIDYIQVWSHILMTVDSQQNLKLYVNNKLIQSLTFTGEIPSSSGQGIRLMKNHTNLEENVDGYLAKVDIYDKAFTHSDVSAVWNSNKSRFGL